MSSDESWHVRDIAPEIRETAREAARRQGVSVSQWLQSLIATSTETGKSAAKSQSAPSVPSAALNDRFDALSDQLTRLSKAGCAAPAAAAKAQSDLNDSLRAIEGRIDALGRGAEPFAPTQHLLEVLTRLNHRLDRLMDGDETARDLARRASAAAFEVREAATAGLSEMPATDDWSTDLDQAIAEISARQHLLQTDTVASGRAPRAASPPAGPQPTAPYSNAPHSTAPQSAFTAEGAKPASGIAELQGRLDHLSEELRILRAPGGLADQVQGMREELAQISRAMSQAAPRRVLEALEGEVHALVERIDKGRRIGADPTALSGLESMLNELRESIQAMTPAENLAGFRDDVRALDRKIELIGAQGINSTGLPQLQRAVADLREIASRAATGDAMVALAEEVQVLGERIDRYVGANPVSEDLLATLDKRFQALASDLNARGGNVGGPAIDDLVAIVEALSGKIDTLEIGRESLPMLDAIVQHLTGLAERIEASGARLDQLENIERSFSVLLERMDALRAETIETAERVAREALSAHGATISRAGPEVDTLRENLVSLRENQQQSDQRTQDTLEAVHDTLERLVDRMAAIESGLRGGESVARIAGPRQLDPVQSPAIAPSTPEMRSRQTTNPPADRKPIDPTLPADYPLEPGAVRARGPATGSAAERIAASEAALGAAKPAQPPADAKANFIAAARRAAQAAASMSANPDEVEEPARSDPSTFANIAQKLRGRRPVVFAVALLVGASASYVTLHGTPFDLGRWSGAQAPRIIAKKDEAKAPAQVATAPAKTEDAAKAPESPPAPHLAFTFEPAASGKPLESAPPQDATASLQPPLARPAAATMPSISPTTLATIQLPIGDVTGSLGRATGVTTQKPLARPATPAVSALPGAGLLAAPEGLPPRLRAAAASGDAKAEYEIATRYLDGRGVTQNMQEAAAWFERAAARDLAPAQYRLGSLYEKGQGVKKDIDQARRLYRAAADSGNGKAMHNLAVLYAEGVEGKPDFRLAAHWFRKAAQHGIADSQYNFAILHARGLGVEQSISESYKWFALAAQQGDKEAAKKRDEIAGRLDQAAAAAVRVSVQSFTPDPQPDAAVNVAPPAGGWDAPLERDGRAKARTGAPAPRKSGT